MIIDTIFDFFEVSYTIIIQDIQAGGPGYCDYSGFYVPRGVL